MKKLPINAKAQRERLLKRLHMGPITTIEARHEEDVLAVAPRIYELRHNEGLNIITLWTTALNPGGQTHRVAQYILMPGKYEGK